VATAGAADIIGSEVTPARRRRRAGPSPRRSLEMHSLSRRQWLARGLAGAAAAGCLSAGTRRAAADPLGLPIGLQLYTVRDQVGKDFEGTLKQVAAIGYQEVELFSFLGKKAAELRRSLDDAGLRCQSGHVQAQGLQAGLDATIDFAKELGLKYLVCPFPGLAPSRSGAQAKGEATKGTSFLNLFALDNWKWNAELFNTAGERAKKAGLQFAYHNHHVEFKKFDGETAFDVILKRTDPEWVKIELDCGWVTVAGEDPAAFIARHADRVALLHVKDVKKGFQPTTNFGAVPFTEVGRGVVDWRKVFEAAKQAGVQRYYVEQDTTERPPLEAVKISRDFLHELTVA
jgi:sugar phosphate isomerase/epimerase